MKKTIRKKTKSSSSGTKKKSCKNTIFPHISTGDIAALSFTVSGLFLVVMAIMERNRSVATQLTSGAEAGNSLGTNSISQMYLLAVALFFGLLGLVTLIVFKIREL